MSNIPSTGQILIVVHQAGSDPGRVGRALEGLGYTLDVRRPSGGDDLPGHMDDHDGAVIFGGPMSANDDHLEFVRREIDWISVCLEAERPFLGICLGGQMLARALGSNVAPHPEGSFEIGFHPVRATPGGRDLFLDEQFFYQWHGEGFEVPAGGELLARGEIFENQAFRVNGNAYGLQFHPEVSFDIMTRWGRKAAHRLVMPGAQSRSRQRELSRRYNPGVEVWLDDFLTSWLDLSLRPSELPLAAD